MCGRFSLGVNVDRLVGEFGLDPEGLNHEPRYNITPGQELPQPARSRIMSRML